MPQHSDRHVPLQGATNFRDLGGYPGHGSRPLRWRKLFRSDHLAGLTDADHAVLAGLGLARTIDFRGEAERAATPYRLPGVAQHSLVIEPAVVQRMQDLVAAGRQLSAAVVVELMKDLYRAMVTDHAHRFAEMFDLLLQSDPPAVLHCTAGKDRTGVGSALILLALGVPPLSIVITTLVINSRFLVMSSALAPLVAKFPAWQRFLYGLEVTDATFALHIGRYSRLPMRKVEAFTTNIVGHIVWVAATAAGVVIGATVTNIDRFGLDFGMPAMFIAILVPMIRSRVHVVVAIAGGVSLLLFRLLGLSYWAIMAATATAVLAGIAMEQWTRRQPS